VDPLSVRDLALSSNQRATQMVARDVLCHDLGERLPTLLQYQEQLEVGSGTVQKALRVLEGAGAATFRSRGHQGTFIAARHLGRLWAIAGLGVVTVAMPLPDSPEGSGLAAGLREEFDLLGIPLQMRFMHGSGQRLSALGEGRADFAVLSAGAAASARQEASAERWIERDLGAHSYYSEGSLVVLMRPGLSEEDGEAARTIGIDRDSYDHARLTLGEFPDSGAHRYEEHAYPRLPAAVAGRQIDAAVWHRTALPIPLELLGVTWRPLERREAVEASEALSRAVVLADRTRPEVEALLGQLDVERIKGVQGRVLRGEIPPVF
jgi:hypothetical protein